jgi:hypothetical protein
MTLKLQSLDERHPGLTKPMADFYAEAASVCLSRHHTSPVELSVHCGRDAKTRSTTFPPPDAKTLNAWANTTDATEAGAYAVSLAAIEVEEGLVAVRRAETLTGADWYIAAGGTPVGDLENCLRLEVSGVDAGSHAVVQSRLQQKVNQTRRGASNLPAIACVVGFKERVVVALRVSSEE